MFNDSLLPSIRKRKREHERHYEVLIEESDDYKVLTLDLPREVSSSSTSQYLRYIQENINGNAFFNLKYEILSEDPEKIKITVTGIFEEIQQWQQDVLRGRR